MADNTQNTTAARVGVVVGAQPDTVAKHACPNCGYCPHCGRSFGFWHIPAYPVTPIYPPGNYPPFPWYSPFQTTVLCNS